MALSKMSQLNKNSWIYSNDPLVKSYRDQNVKEASKGKLALHATIHTVKCLALSVLSAFGMVIYMASAGRIHNHPWDYARLHGEMASASVRAIFHYKPVMEELRVAEAKSFFSAFLGHKDPLSLVTIIKAPQTNDLLSKLKGLTAVQLEEVFKDVTCGNMQLEIAFLEKLHSLRQDTADFSKAAIIDKHIHRLQSNLHRESGLIACRYKAQEGIRVALLSEKRREAFEKIFPDLKPRLDRLDAARGIEVTQDQYALSMGLGPVTRSYTDNDPALPSPAILDAMVAIGRKNAWNDVIAKAQSACRTYGSVMDQRTFTPQGYAHLFKAAAVLNNREDIAIMRKCMIYRDARVPKTPEERQQLALQGFQMLKTKGSELAIETLEDCLGYLLADPTMQWMPAQASDTDPIINAIHKISYVTSNSDFTARFIENSLASGKLALLDRMESAGRFLARPEDEGRITRAWQNCADQNVRLLAMPALQTLAWPSLAGVQMWPRLNDLLFQHASNPANLQAAPEACEKVLCLRFDKNAVLGSYGPANIHLKPLVLQRLPLAQQLQKLRDNCVDIILTQVGQFASIWLNEQPDLIADALTRTERKADWNRYRPSSQLDCANEGLALLQYANAHPNTALANAARQYLLRTPNNAAYLTAVRGLGAQERANFRLLEELYH